MGLTPGPLVPAIFRFILTITLVVSVAWGLAFFVPIGVESNCEVVTFFCVSTNRSLFQRWLTHRNLLELKFLIFLPD